jgi:2-keto-4-pentenoate hydratase
VRDFNALDLGALRARTLIDGQEVATGLSDALLGHPMDALAWLANRRSRLGLGLEAGTFVSLGSITPVQWVEKPGTFRIEVEALGAVEVAFA